MIMTFIGRNYKPLKPELRAFRPPADFADLCPMEKKIIHTPDAPAPIGPYSQAVQAGPMLFISGQIPLDPKTGNVEASDITGETHQVMHNLKAILSAAGADFSHVVKTTILLSDMSLFSTVNEIYGKYFTGDFPARETYAVKTLPKNVNIEISMVALTPGS
jgi:2-iminobutanoate/2-iminopropanoate deaminase